MSDVDLADESVMAAQRWFDLVLAGDIEAALLLTHPDERQSSRRNGQATPRTGRSAASPAADPLGASNPQEETPMYHYQCDWCHKRINTHREQYVEAHITVITGERDRYGKAENETEPTRFFHVAPRRSRDEWDRLGLEVNSEEIGDCCYTRALRAIERPEWDEPDAGMEWRLLPVGARVTADGEVEEPRERDPIDLMPLWRQEEHHREGAWWAPSKDHRVFLLARVLLDGRTRGYQYVSAGIKTVGDLRDAVSSGHLLSVSGVGPKRSQQIARALEEFLATSHDGDEREAVAA